MLLGKNMKIKLCMLMIISISLLCGCNQEDDGKYYTREDLDEYYENGYERGYDEAVFEYYDSRYEEGYDVGYEDCLYDIENGYTEINTTEE